jgi:hypothetical protein
LVTPVLLLDGDAPAIVGNAPPNESGCRLRPLPLPPVVVVGFSSAIYLVKKSSRRPQKFGRRFKLQILPSTVKRNRRIEL